MASLPDCGDGAVYQGVVMNYLGGDFGLIKHSALGKGFFANEGVLICSVHKLMCTDQSCPHYRPYRLDDFEHVPLSTLLQPGSMISFRLVPRRDHIDYSYQASMVWPTLSAEPSVLEELSSAAMSAQYARVKALDYGEKPVPVVQPQELSTFGGLGGLGGYNRSLSNVRPASLEESLQNFTLEEPEEPKPKPKPSTTSSTVLTDLENMLDSIEKIRDFVREQVDVSSVADKAMTKLSRTILYSEVKDENLRAILGAFMEEHGVDYKPGKRETMVLANLRVLLHGLNIRRKGVSSSTPLTPSKSASSLASANSTAAASPIKSSFKPPSNRLELTNPSMDFASSSLMNIINQGARQQQQASSGRSTPNLRLQQQASVAGKAAASAPVTPSHSNKNRTSSADEKKVIKIKDEANDEILEIPADDLGRLSLDILDVVFPGVRALKFKNETSGGMRVLNMAPGNYFEAPAGGWGDRVYLPHIVPVPVSASSSQSEKKENVAPVQNEKSGVLAPAPPGFPGGMLPVNPGAAGAGLPPVSYQDQLFQQFFHRELLARGLNPPAHNLYNPYGNGAGYNGYPGPY